MKIWTGKPYPLGATWDGAGVNVSLFSENANKVELCLFDGPEGQRETCIPMREQTHQIWRIYLPEARPCQFYRYRVDGPCRHFLPGQRIRGSEAKDLAWFRSDGKEMDDEDWNNMEVRCFGLRLAGDAVAELDDRSNRIVDDTLLILLNAHHVAIPFTLPAHRRKVCWGILLDTYDPISDRKKRRTMRGGDICDIKDRSIAVLQLPRSTNLEEKRTRSRSALRQIKGIVENRPLP